VARILGEHMVKNVKGSVVKLGVQQYLGKSADMFKKGALGKVGGGAAGNVGGALKGLLGK